MLEIITASVFLASMGILFAGIALIWDKIF